MMGETERVRTRKVEVRVLFFESNWMTHALLIFDCNFSPHNTPKYTAKVPTGRVWRCAVVIRYRVLPVRFGVTAYALL